MSYEYGGHDAKYRLTRIMKAYDPEKVKKVDVALGSFKGREEKLIQDQLKKFEKPEPPPEPLEVRISRFFQKYDQPSVGQANSLAEQYKGRELECLQMLHNKYGPEPEPPAPSMNQAAAMSSNNVPLANTNSQVPPSAAPTNVAPASGQGARAQQKARLVRFYKHYQPAGKPDSEIEGSLDKYCTSQEGEREMWTKLRDKYGPEPEDNTGQYERLKAFYSKYQAKLQQPKTDEDIRNAVFKYEVEQGGFKEMWRKLEDKYGPEGTPGGMQASQSQQPPQQQLSPSQPPPPQAASVTGTKPVDPRSLSQKERLTRFYAKYVPGKTEKEIDNAVAKYAVQEGGYDTMWATLEHKYGPEAAVYAQSANSYGATSDDEVRQQKERLVRFYARYAPEKTQVEIDNAVQKYRTAEGGYERMWTTLRGKYGPEPIEGESNTTYWMKPEDLEQKKRLMKFYEKYAPNKTEVEVDIALKKYSGSEGGYAAMWSVLEQKYGPEPKMAASATGSKPGELSQKERLVRFYAKYAPTKTEAEIDLALNKYATHPRGYDQMWETLTGKYGPEPTKPDEEAVIAMPTNPRLDLPGVKAPAHMIDDDMNTKNSAGVRIGSQLKNTTSRNNEIASYGTGMTVLSIIIKFFGADFGLYERSPGDKKHKFREAVEYEIARNMGVHVRQVQLHRLTAGSINAELDVEIPSSENSQQVSDDLVTKVQGGGFIVAGIRDSYRKDLGGNPIQVYAQTVTILGHQSSNPAEAVPFSRSSIPRNQVSSAPSAQQASMMNANPMAVYNNQGGYQGPTFGAPQVPPVSVNSVPVQYSQRHNSNQSVWSAPPPAHHHATGVASNLWPSISQQASPQRHIPSASQQQQSPYYSQAGGQGGFLGTLWDKGGNSMGNERSADIEQNNGGLPTQQWRPVHSPYTRPVTREQSGGQWYTNLHTANVNAIRPPSVGIQHLSSHHNTHVRDVGDGYGVAAHIPPPVMSPGQSNASRFGLHGGSGGDSSQGYSQGYQQGGSQYGPPPALRGGSSGRDQYVMDIVSALNQGPMQQQPNRYPR